MPNRLRILQLSVLEFCVFLNHLPVFLHQDWVTQRNLWVWKSYELIWFKCLILVMSFLSWLYLIVRRPDFIQVFIFVKLIQILFVEFIINSTVSHFEILVNKVAHWIFKLYIFRLLLECFIYLALKFGSRDTLLLSWELVRHTIVIFRVNLMLNSKGLRRRSVR